eukprot:29037-Pelagococcus_subviridis.AAC.1
MISARCQAVRLPQTCALARGERQNPSKIPASNVRAPVQVRLARARVRPPLSDPPLRIVAG